MQTDIDATATPQSIPDRWVRISEWPLTWPTSSGIRSRIHAARRRGEELAWTRRYGGAILVNPARFAAAIEAGPSATAPKS